MSRRTFWIEHVCTGQKKIMDHTHSPKHWSSVVRRISRWGHLQLQRNWEQHGLHDTLSLKKHTKPKRTKKYPSTWAKDQEFKGILDYMSRFSLAWVTYLDFYQLLLLLMPLSQLLPPQPQSSTHTHIPSPFKKDL